MKRAGGAKVALVEIKRIDNLDFKMMKKSVAARLLKLIVGNSTSIYAYVALLRQFIQIYIRTIHNYARKRVTNRIDHDRKFALFRINPNS